MRDSMSHYLIREATERDQAALIRHRVRMFEDMGRRFDASDLSERYRVWLADMMARGTYRGWVAEDASTIVAGGGITLLPWPPGPHYPGPRLAFVYNVYTEPEHRNRGLGRRIMEAIHAWCRTEGIVSLALNASEFGRSLYESMGYRVTDSPMMFLSLD